MIGMKRCILSIAALVLAVFPADAGGPGYEALPFLRLQRDPSALTAGAAQVFASQAYSVFSNPTLPFAVEESGGLALSYSRWAANETNEFDACGAFKISSRFSLGVGFSYGLNPEYDVYTDAGDISGSFSPADMIAGIGAGYRITDVFSLGVNVRYASSRLTESYSYGAFSGDLFVAMRRSRLTATVGVSNLGPSVKSFSTGSYSLPSSASVGLGYNEALGEAVVARIQLTGDCYLSGAVSAGAGAEMIIKDLLSLRMGYNYGGESVIPSFASAGIGLKTAGFEFNAALYLAGKDIGNSISAGLGFCF